MNNYIDELIQKYKNFLNENPENYEVQYKLAVLYYSKSNYSKVKGLVEKLISAEFYNSEYQNLYGMVLQKEEKYIESVKYFKIALNISRKADYYNNLALSYLSLGINFYAVSAFRKALEISDEPGIHLNLGNLLICLNKEKEALKYFTNAYNLEPENNGNLIEYFSLLVKEGQSKLVFNELINSGETDSDIELQVILFASMQKLGFNNKADDLFNKIKAITESKVLLLEKAAKRSEILDLKEADWFYSELYSFDPENDLAGLNKGRKIFKEGKISESIEIYSKLLRGKKCKPEVIIEFVEILITFSQREYAVQLLDSYLEENSDLSICQFKSELFFQQNCFSEGIKELNKTRGLFKYDLNKSKIWKGENLSNKTLLIRIPFGIEDFLYFHNLPEYLKLSDTKIIVECPVEYHQIVKEFRGVDKCITHFQVDERFYDYEVLFYDIPFFKNESEVKGLLVRNGKEKPVFPAGYNKENEKSKIGVYLDYNSGFLENNSEIFNTQLTEFLDSKLFSFIVSDDCKKIIVNKENLSFTDKNKDPWELLNELKELDFIVTNNKLVVSLANLVKLKTSVILSGFGRSFSELNYEINPFIKIYESKNLVTPGEIIQEMEFDIILENNKIKTDSLLTEAEKQLNRKNTNKAMKLFNKVLSIEKNATAFFKSGYISGLRGEYEKALGYYYAALEISPSNVNIYNNIASVLKEMKEFKKAEEIYNNSIEHFPDNAFLLSNTATIKTLLGKFDEAELLFKKALNSDPCSANTYLNFSNYYLYKNDNNSAKKCLEKALELNPDDADIHFNYGCCILREKNLEEGLSEYEWRKKLESYPVLKFNKPELESTSVKDKRILVFDEQGFGDSLQFVRYLKLLKNSGAYIIFVCYKQLYEFYKQQDFIDEVYIQGDNINNFYYDFHISLLSLPKLFNTSYDTIYSPFGYLKTYNILDDFVDSKALNVAFVWKGRQPVNNIQRSVSLENFTDIFNIPDVNFYSIQKEDITENEKEILKKYCVKDFSEKLNTFLDTANIIGQMDLVISIDTAVAHLAGALGKVVWLLLPLNADWRWFNNKRSVWYPNTTIIKQKLYSDWSNVFTEINDKLINYKKGDK